MILNKYFIPVILQQKPHQVVAKFTRKWMLLVENAICITFFFPPVKPTHKDNIFGFINAMLKDHKS